MILTTCAACAKPLEHDAPAHCVNCQTRYCSDRCLRYHAHRGGHDDARWLRWYTCRLCEQKYHGDVKCALGWACWKTYVGRPEADWARRAAMSVLGNGLDAVGHNADALVVQEAELAMLRRIGGSENDILAT